MAPARHGSPGITNRGSRHASLPVERAFVVQLRADSDIASGVIRGRVEHVVSGAAALFDSIEELVSAMRDAVSGRRTCAPGGDDHTTR